MIAAEEQRLPAGFLDQLVEYRDYAAAFFLNRLDEKNWNSTTMRRLAKEIEHALAQEAHDKTHG